jgi:hypothetical protein
MTGVITRGARVGPNEIGHPWPLIDHRVSGTTTSVS